MRNLDWLYQTNGMFRETVNQGAAQWMGSDSPVFAGEWLLREHEYEHHDSDYEDLTGQHLDGPCVVPDGFCSDAAKLQISQFVAQETGETAESDAAKSEIRDFDDSREKLEADVDTALYGASMADDGYIPLKMAIGWLDRQAAITRKECNALCGTCATEQDEQIEELEAFVKRLESAAESGDDVTLFGVDYVSDSKFATLKEHCAGQAEQLRRLTDENAELRKLAEKYRAGSIAAQEEAEAWRAKCGKLLDAAHEMVRIGGDA